MKGSIRHNTLNFKLTFLQRFSMEYWNFNLLSKIMLSNFSFFGFVIVKLPSLIIGFSIAVLCASYLSYPRVIRPVQQLVCISSSYQVYSSVIRSIQQFSGLFNIYQLYPTVIIFIRQSSALLHSFSVYNCLLS